MKTNQKPMTRWLLSFVFALVVISLLLLPQVLKVDSHADYPREDISEGATEIHITNAAQFAQLLARTWNNQNTSNQDNLWAGKTFYLDCDINLRSITTQPSLTYTTTTTGQDTTAGSLTMPTYDGSDTANKGRFDKTNNNYIKTFAGTFDGQGHTISGLYWYKNGGGNARWQGGIFDRFSGTIRNLRLTDSYFEWDQPKTDNNCSLGAIVGGITKDGVVENVYVDSTVWLVTHRTTDGNCQQYVGGIAGWCAGTIRNCVSYANVVSCVSQGNRSYPLANAKIQVGGISGQIEGSGKIQNCLADPTIYANVPERSQTSVNTGYGDGNIGWCKTTPAKDGSSWTVTNAVAGKQTTAPYSDWKDFTFDMGTFVPAAFGFTQSIDDYDSSMKHWGTTVTIANWSDFESMISKVNANNSKGQGTIFKLTADIAQFGDKTFVSRSTWASGAAITIPAYPAANNFVRFANFKGVLDGDGHVLSGVFARRVAYNSTHEGGLFMEFNGAIENLAITNSFFCGDHTKNGSGTAYGNSTGMIIGGLAGKGSGRIENCYFDYDCFLINNYGSAGYGYLFGQQCGNLIVKDVTCAGRFWVCNTSLQNTIATTSGSACGVIAGDGKGYKTTIENFAFTGPRSTYIAGSGGTNDVAFLVHWTNSCTFSGTNFYGKTNGSAGNTAGKTPEADGTNYAFVPALAQVGVKKNAETFTDAFKFPLFAQTATNKLRITAKVPELLAKDTDLGAIGFRFTRSDTGATTSVTIKSLYKSLKSGSTVKNAYEIAGKGDYLYALVLTNIPSGLSLTVEPYVVFDGVTYYGKPAYYP